MILLIDAGNTRIKWRVVEASAPLQARAEGAFAHDALDALPSALTDVRARHPGLQRAFGCNVAGATIAARIAEACSGLSLEWLTSTAACAGVRHLDENPSQLGADRWAAAIGARALHPHACLVVMAGTATTVDLLSGTAEFLGGLILPGVALMQQALARGTAQLPLADGLFALQPRRTVDAIHSGCLQAQAGAIERMFRQSSAEETIARCLVTGGAASQIVPHLGVPWRMEATLILDGLLQYAS